MKMKKIISAALALTMIMALSVPVLAEEGTSQDLEITGSTSVPVIDVTIPTTTAVVINPYQLSVTDPNGDGSTKTTDQVIFTNGYIENNGETAVIVSISATGTVSGSAAFATAAPSEKASTKNDVYLYAEFSETFAPGSDVDAALASAAFADGYSKTTDLLIAAKAATLSNVLTLAAASDDGSTKACAGFRLAGEANSAPTTAWTATDTVSVKITFSFTPTVISE